VADDDRVFAAWIKQGLPGGEGMRLAIARMRRHPALVAALRDGLSGIDKHNRDEWMYALANQADRALGRRLFSLRESVPDFQPHLAYTLECIFRVGIGSNLNDWAEYLETTE
jgi:hypothetical protein